MNLRTFAWTPENPSTVEHADLTKADDEVQLYAAALDVAARDQGFSYAVYDMGFLLWQLVRHYAADTRHGCSFPHFPLDNTAVIRVPDRPDFQEPGIAMARFNPLGLLRGYGQASGLRCFMFTTAAVYAPDREAAEAFADAHELRGPQAREYHADLS